MSRWLKWTPRVLTILYICFLSLFALDVFSEGYRWYEAIVGFIMHMIPSFMLIGLLVWAWHKPKWGGIAFLVLAAVFTIWFNTYRDLVVFAMITGPALLAGLLFFLSTKK